MSAGRKTKRSSEGQRRRPARLVTSAAQGQACGSVVAACRRGHAAVGATSDGGGKATSGSLDLSPFLAAIGRTIEIDDHDDYAEAYSQA